jgi:hypothetical protein
MLVVDFIDEDNYISTRLHTIIGAFKNLQRAKKVIENIKKAIKNKYEVLKFKDLFNYNENVQYVELS